MSHPIKKKASGTTATSTPSAEGYVYRPAPRSALSPRRTVASQPTVPAPALMHEDESHSAAAKHIAKAKAAAAAKYAATEAAKHEAQAAQAALTRKPTLTHQPSVGGGGGSGVTSATHSPTLGSMNSKTGSNGVSGSPTIKPVDATQSAVSKFMSKLKRKSTGESAPTNDQTNGEHANETNGTTHTNGATSTTSNGPISTPEKMAALKFMKLADKKTESNGNGTTAAPSSQSAVEAIASQSTAPVLEERAPSLGRMKSPWNLIASAALSAVKQAKQDPATVQATKPTEPTQSQPPVVERQASVPSTIAAPSKAESSEKPSLGRMKSPWNLIAAAAIASVREAKKEEAAPAPVPVPIPVQSLPVSTTSAIIVPTPIKPAPSTAVTNAAAAFATPVKSPQQQPQPTSTQPQPTAAVAAAASPSVSKRASGGAGGQWDFLASSAIAAVRERAKNMETLEKQAMAQQQATQQTTISPLSSAPSSPQLLSRQGSTTMAKPIMNSSAVLVAKNQLLVKNIPLQALPSSAVLVEIKSVGICGSDVHYHQHGRIGDFIVKEPMILGHEAAGRIVALGSGVSRSLGLEVGDRVALEPGLGCGQCPRCKEGRYNLCPDMKFLATPPIHGALVSYLTHPAHLCHKLPPSVSYEEGALCEPLSVAIHAERRSGLKTGDSVLITGAGPIGLLVAMVARHSGARRVILQDISLPRLRMAQEILARGDTETIQVVHVQAGEKAEDTIKKIRAANQGDQVDVAFECSGNESAASVALKSIRSGGCLLLIGMGGASPNIALPLATECLQREIDVRGIFRYVNTYPTAIQLIQSKKIPVMKLITHRLNLRPETVTATAATSTAASTSTSPSSSTPASPKLSPATTRSPSISTEIRDLGSLDSEQLLAGFEIAHTGHGQGMDAIKVMFSL